MAPSRSAAVSHFEVGFDMLDLVCHRITLFNIITGGKAISLETQSVYIVGKLAGQLNASPECDVNGAASR